MSNYFLEFTAYVDERKRPENFPKQVYHKEVLRSIESIEHLQYEVNKRFLGLVNSPGFVSLKNPDEILEQNVITFDRRMFIPWHLLTHMTANVKLITEIPDNDDLTLIAPTESDVSEMKKDRTN